ncbi:hypothetical protein FOA52_005911 [Chlamydomonas sp. UWO 241]|nr:hypothetical protein FOA52_005911 [Chlamydomonas sp. UWO 241]
MGGSRGLHYASLLLMLLLIAAIALAAVNTVLEQRRAAAAAAAAAAAKIARRTPDALAAARQVLSAWQYPNVFNASEQKPQAGWLQMANVRCLVRVSYSNATRKLVSGPVLAPCAHVSSRLRPMLLALELGLSRHGDALKIESNFSFYLDLIDWAEEVQTDLPVVGMTRLGAAKTTLVLPDVYMYGAAVWEHTHDESAWHLAELFSRLYYPPGGNLTPPAWGDKPARLVYRGSCIPTRMQGHDIGSPEGWLRAGACTALTGDAAQTENASAAIDFGLTVDGLCTTDEGWKTGGLGVMCGQCRRCPPTGQKIERGETSVNKFQLVIDGFGVPYDSTWTKLSSRSTVLWLTPHADGELNWLPWYASVLTPGEHYIPTSAADIDAIVRRCLANDAACRAIAEAAYETMQTYASPDIGLAYGAVLMEHVWSMTRAAR